MLELVRWDGSDVTTHDPLRIKVEYSDPDEGHL
jgi:hypothetical protein